MTGITRHNLANPQLLHADVDPMIGTNSTDTPITDTEQRRKRQDAVNYARASVGLEGFKLSNEIDIAEFVEPEPKWSQGEAIAFECAREVISDLNAILTGEIAEESDKPSPDVARIASLRAERSRLFQERANLHVHDYEEIARIRAKYGAKVRAWRAR